MYFDQGEQREVKVSVMWKRAQGRKKVLTSVNWKERVFVLTPKTLNYFEGSCEVRLGKCIINLLSARKISNSAMQCKNVILCTDVCFVCSYCNGSFPADRNS